MTISSRTPEGLPNQCPVCGKSVNITPSDPAGDATCPNCGSLLWFTVTDGGTLFYRRPNIVPADRRAIWPDSLEVDESAMDDDRSSNDFSIGDHVRVVRGDIGTFEGDVETIDPEHGRVTISINVYGRSTPVELESWQLQRIDS